MRFIVVFLACMFVSELSAQTLRIHVRSGDSPLPLANIYINGVILRCSDLEGIAEIPESSLSPGDTISSSYLGFEPAFAVYDEDMRAARSCTLVHSKVKTYELGTSVITGRRGDDMEAFHRYVEPRKPDWGKRTFRGNIEARVAVSTASSVT